jgi:hypothetical protein
MTRNDGIGLGSVRHQRAELRWPNPEGAALKSAISAPLAVEYARHVLPPRSWNWRISAAAQPVC